MRVYSINGLPLNEAVFPSDSNLASLWLILWCPYSFPRDSMTRVCVCVHARVRVVRVHTLACLNCRCGCSETLLPRPVIRTSGHSTCVLLLLALAHTGHTCAHIGGILFEVYSPPCM